MNSLVAADYGSGSSDAYSSDEDEKNKSIREPEASAKNSNKISITSTTNDNNDYFMRNDDSDSSSDSDNENECKKNDDKITKHTQTLPSASSLLSSASVTGQVFNNPYKVAENAKIASLEKHVKMVDTDANTQMKNGKKICWNYRKGRCRFGSSCTFAHDSDLNVDAPAEPPPAKYDPNSSSASRGTTGYTHQPKTKSSNKKRPGLGDSIVPSKKVMKSYNNSR